MITSLRCKPNIGYTMVYRIISLAPGEGKTSLGEEVVGYLSKKGVRIAVIKQFHTSMIPPESDAYRYKCAGAHEIVVSSPKETIIYKEPMLSLREIIANIEYYPIIIVEGFRGATIGKAIAIIESEEELSHVLTEPGLSLIVSHVFDLVEVAKEKGLHAILFDEIESIAEWIYKDALTGLASLLPGDNCGLCGVGTCLEFAEKILYGEMSPFDCPRITRVKLIVDDKDVPIDPRVEKILLYSIRGIISVLEDVPEKPSKIELKIMLK